MNPISNKSTQLLNLGLIDYQRGWDYQTRLFDEILTTKKNNREKPGHEQLQTPNYLITCEHPHVYTLGKSGNEKNLLIPTERLTTIGATYVHTNRGGDITYHGPGQLVVYPVIDLENFFTDIHRYMRSLEEAVIQTLAIFGITAGRSPGLTGVWLDANTHHRARKICAMGVKTSRWVTLHGLALNVNPDLSYFNYIVPCGIENKAVTSMKHELDRELPLADVQKELVRQLARIFEFDLC
ncbi:MAG: lipoyl(octanoyl) transferase LipB [Cyclobacteriaceae bacterium]